MLIQYRVMQEKDVSPAAHCLTESFINWEPLTVHMQIDYAEFYTFAYTICQSVLASKLSIVAACDEKIIGVRLAGIHEKTGKNIGLDLSKNLQPIFALLNALRTSEIAHIPVDNSIHLKMLGVKKQFTNKGIAQTLLIETLNNAKHNGHHYAVVESTTHITQHIFLNKLNFKALNSISYATFTYNKKNIFATLASQTKNKFAMLLGRKI